MEIIVTGMPSDGFIWKVNSPDLDGNSEVGLADFARFAQHFNGVNPCADYNESGGGVSVADFGIFATIFNSCVRAP